MSLLAQFVDGNGRPCDHAETLCVAKVEVLQIQFISGSQWTFQFATERGTRLSAVVVMAAMNGFSPFLGHFSRSSRLSGVERQFSEPSMAKSSLPSRAPAQFTLSTRRHRHSA